MIYLKPCPFCGEKKIGCDKWTTLDGSVYRFSCATYNTDGPLGHDVKEAQERWNKRISDWTRFDLHPTEVECYLESGTEFSKDLWWKLLDSDDLPKEMTL